MNLIRSTLKDCLAKKMDEEKEPHPWGEFLKARVKCILWMKNEMKRDDQTIACDLSMDTEQVRLIREFAEKHPNG